MKEYIKQLRDMRAKLGEIKKDDSVPESARSKIHNAQHMLMDAEGELIGITRKEDL